MNVWQVYAAVLAVMAPVVAVARLARSRRWSTVVWLMQLLAFPEAAFASYALAPGDEPSFIVLAPLVIAFFGAAIGSVIWTIFERGRLTRATVGLDAIQRQHVVVVVVRAGFVFFLSAFAFLFVPWLAILNLAANAAWTVAWIPKRRRRVEFRVTYEVAADPCRVFDFVSNTDNWPRFRDDFVRASPPGPVRIGTEIVTKLPIDWLSEDPSPRLAKSAEVRSTVTSLTPDREFSLAVVGRPDQTSTSELTAKVGGTVVTSVARGALTFPEAVMGFRFELPNVIATRRAMAERDAARLKEVLEAPGPGLN